MKEMDLICQDLAPKLLPWISLVPATISRSCGWIQKGRTVLGCRSDICECAGIFCRKDMKSRGRVQTGDSLSGALSSSCQYQQTHWLIVINNIFRDRGAASDAGAGVESML